jgi:CheY-like chemotaxis protein
VADDEKAVRNVAAMILEHQGFQVVVAEDGKRAVERFREHAGEIQAVLLDVTMPEMSGREVLGEIRRIQPGAKVMFSSGYTEQEVPTELLADEHTAFIQKPYRAAVLTEKLEALLSRNDDHAPSP